MLDVPVKFEAEKYKFDDPDHSEVNSLFDELEFRRIKETFKKIFQREKLNNLDDVHREGKQFDLLRHLEAALRMRIKNQKGKIFQIQNIYISRWRLIWEGGYY